MKSFGPYLSFSICLLIFGGGNFTLFCQDLGLPIRNYNWFEESAKEGESKLYWLEKGLEIGKAEDDAHMIASAYQELGKYHRETGNNVLALRYTIQALEALQSKDPDTLRGRLYISLGHSYELEGQITKAKLQYRTALQEGNEVQDYVGSGGAYLGLALCSIYEQQLDSAKYFSQQARKLFQSVQDVKDEVTAESYLLNLEAMNGNLEEAIQIGNRGIKRAKQYGAPSTIATSLNNLASFYQYVGKEYYANKDFDSARANYLKAFELLNSALPYIENSPQDYSPLSSTIYYNLSQVYQDLEDDSQGVKMLQKHLEIKDSLISKEKNRIYANLDHQFKQSQTARENISLQQEKLTLQTNLNWLLLGLVALIIVTLSVYLLSLRRQQRHQAEVEGLLEEREQVALGSMLRGQEDAYKRIGKELHDHVGMLLATVKLHFNNLEDKLDTQIDQLDTASDILDKATQAVRNYSHELFSGTLEHFGLVEALKELARDLSSSQKLNVQVESYQMDEAKIPDSIAHAVYRVTQELLSNIIRHAKADTATIQLTRRKQELNVIIADNGVGFQIPQGQPFKGIGLRSMAARLQELGGTYHIDSQKGKGTRIVLDIPIHETTEDWLS
ncbi:MAG: sensor histidine kinase [Bacteroidota bacterium]